MLDPAGKVRKVWLYYALLLHKSIIRSYNARDVEEILDFLELFRQKLTIFSLVFITRLHSEMPCPVFQLLNVVCGLVLCPQLQLFLYSFLHLRFKASTQSCFLLNFFLAFSFYHYYFICKELLYFLYVTFEDLLVHIHGSLSVNSCIEIREYLLLDLLKRFYDMLDCLNDVDRDVPPCLRFDILWQIIDSVERIIWSSH